MDYHKNAAFYHNIGFRPAPRSPKSVEASRITCEDQNRTIREVAFHFRMVSRR